MKTREDLYSKEAAELIRVVSSYKALYTEQVIRLFPNQEEKIRTLINSFRQQKRIWLSQDGKMIKVSEDVETDAGTIKAFWILLDFIDRVEYHNVGSFPVNLSFFLDAEFYEVAFVSQNQEALISHALAGKPDEIGKRIVIVDDSEQIEKINIPGAGGFCTVSENGTIQYYQRK